MIGSGSSCSRLARPFGGISLIGWIVSTGGLICLALVFALAGALQSGSRRSACAFTRQAFGDLAGFLVAWGYWICWCTTAASPWPSVGYLDPFIPRSSASPVARGNSWR